MPEPQIGHLLSLEDLCSLRIALRVDSTDFSSTRVITAVLPLRRNSLSHICGNSVSASSAFRFRFLPFLCVVSRAWLGGGLCLSFSKIIDSNRPVWIKSANTALKCVGVLSTGTLTTNRLLESVSVGILGAWGRR